MIIIGEKLNSSIPKTQSAFEKKDENTVIAMIEAQEACGSLFLDINTAMLGGDELEAMLWVIDLVQTHSHCGLMLDSPSASVIRGALARVDGRAVVVNSITAAERFDLYLPMVCAAHADVVGLPISGRSPTSIRERLENVQKLVEICERYSVDCSRLYVDILVESIATNTESATVALGTLTGIQELFPDVKTICGLSNISFGLPKRMNINAHFLSMLNERGLSCAIMDSTSETMQSAYRIGDMLCGRDEYCMEFIEYSRKA